ncbi:MAG: hypothetical protein ACO1SX_25040 [Actinomycetota bacterium]
MPGQPCVNHAKEITFVRCNQCDAPICVNCMVDAPVGKKCRKCARITSHVTESMPQHVALAFVAAVAVALPAGWLVHRVPIMILPAVAYGWLVAEVTLRVGKRRRSVGMQVAAGIAAAIGARAGPVRYWLPLFLGAGSEGLAGAMWPLASVGIGVMVAVSRVRSH